MKYLLVMILIVFTLHARDKTVAEYGDEIVGLSYDQKVVLIKSYMLGVKSDYGYTLAAVAWKESNLGYYKMNLNDGSNFKYHGSFGVYHCLLNTAMNRSKHNSQWWASRIAEKLYTDMTYSSEQAISELEYWEVYWTRKGVSRVYSHTIASYNAGFNSVNCDLGKAYSKDILNRIKAIKKYFKEFRISEIIK